MTRTVSMNQLNVVKHSFSYGLTVSAFVMLSSCAATQMTLEHRNLEVSSRMSDSIFLDPVRSSQKTVFIDTKNTSDVAINFKQYLAKAFVKKGYKVLSNPQGAHYLVQTNVLNVGKMSASASQSALGGGYGSALAGATAGIAAGSLIGTSQSLLGGGIAGGVIGLTADALVKDVNYSMITDVQISERVEKGVNEQFNGSLKNGSASLIHQSYTKHSNYQRFRTRIVSNADKVNLKFETARPLLEQGLVQCIAGIF